MSKTPPNFDPAYADRLRSAIFDAILASSMHGIGGTPTPVVRNHEVLDACTRAIVAFCMCPGTGGRQRPADVKKVFDRHVNAAFREAQAAQARTG